MKFYKKIRIHKPNYVCRKYKFCGITLFKKEISAYVSMWILGIRFAKFKNKKHIQNIPTSQEVIRLFIDSLSPQKRTVLWIDHSLGGGTEVYSRNVFEEGLSTTNFIRMQFFAYNLSYQLASINKEGEKKLVFVSLQEIWDFLGGLKISEVIVNNLVGYPKSTDILEKVKEFKEAHSQTKVSFRGHDYHCICPSFYLLDYNDTYCRLQSQNCETCLSKKRFHESDWENGILRSGATTLAEWRQAWGDFFSTTLDEFVAFSSEVSKLFISIYPQLEDKTIIVPHKTREYPTVEVPSHKGINIGFLGDMGLICKGRRVVLDLLNYIESYDNGINLKIIGDFDVSHPKLHATGRYTSDNLPELIQKEKIDIIFISSIWPETFSYTTSEAMSMNIPIACFNLGAPYERVSKYSKGLILEDFNTKYIVDKIKQFLNK